MVTILGSRQWHAMAVAALRYPEGGWTAPVHRPLSTHRRAFGELDVWMPQDVGLDTGETRAIPAAFGGIAPATRHRVAAA